MKTQTVILLAVVALLLVGSVAWAQSGRPPGYVVEQGVLSGGGYRLSGPGWQFSGAAGGGGYRLLGPAMPSLRGSGCCCNYLPCVLRQAP